MLRLARHLRHYIRLGGDSTPRLAALASKLQDLTPLTGYVRGGCSPIGMKKKFPTWVAGVAAAQEKIYVNAGARGLQVSIAPGDLLRAAEAQYADLV